MSPRQGIHHRKVVQAKHIDDVFALRDLERISREKRGWVCIWDLTEAWQAIPPGVIRAKMSRLIDRGLITGCCCGCRGDWELTTAGREFAGIEGAWRRNPMETHA